MIIFSGNQSVQGVALGRILGCHFPESLRTRIILGHELGHNFGLKHDDGYHFSAGGRKLGTLMRTREVGAGHCCTDDYGFYRFDKVDKPARLTVVADCVKRWHCLDKVANDGVDNRNCLFFRITSELKENYFKVER